MKIINVVDLKGLAIVASGSYTGDNTANRAIPHGLGRKPKVVFLVDSAHLRDFFMHSLSTDIFIGNQNESRTITLAAKDAINFYVGNASDYFGSANKSGKVYYWVAFG